MTAVLGLTNDKDRQKFLDQKAKERNMTKPNEKRSISEMIAKGSLHALKEIGLYTIHESKVPKNTPTIQQILRKHQCEGVEQQTCVTFFGSRAYMSSLANRISKNIPCKIEGNFLARWYDNETFSLRCQEASIIQYCGIVVDDLNGEASSDADDQSNTGHPHENAVSYLANGSFDSPEHFRLIAEMFILRDEHETPIMCIFNGVHGENPVEIHRFSIKNFPYNYQVIIDAYQDLETAC